MINIKFFVYNIIDIPYVWSYYSNLLNNAIKFRNKFS
jgi:hypothetical protein